MSTNNLTSIKSDLNYDERVIWTSKPSASRVFISVLPSILFGILFVVAPLNEKLFSSFIDTIQAQNLFTKIISVGIGSSIIIRSIIIILAAYKTVYVITNCRILIIVNLIRRRVQVFNPVDINKVTTRCALGGFNSVTFREEYINGIDAGIVKRYQFSGIEDVQSALDALQALVLKK